MPATALSAAGAAAALVVAWLRLAAAPVPTAPGCTHGRPAMVRPEREREKRREKGEERKRRGNLREMDLGFDIRDDEDEKRDGKIFIS